MLQFIPGLAIFDRKALVQHVAAPARLELEAMRQLEEAMPDAVAV